MTQQHVPCPVCENSDGSNCVELSGRGRHEFECEVCGKFGVTGTLRNTKLAQGDRRLTAVQRAALSHLLRVNTNAGKEPPVLDTDWLDRFIADARLPDAHEQVRNIVRFIGDHERTSGAPLAKIPRWLHAHVGSASQARAFALMRELLDARTIKVKEEQRARDVSDYSQTSLTLAGWEAYKRATEGSQPGSYGFIALQFGDERLDGFVSTVVKPAVKSLGFDLIDMRDAAQAGVIDNIMRMKIRDAAFILADLTHDNSGAYWEAGFAEGLGKPVLYLCEESKFSKAKSHFDTNHCTTVCWSEDKAREFTETLIATLRNSLRLLPSA